MIFFSDYAIESIFTWDDRKINLDRFLAKSINKADKFNECNKKIFELIQTLTKRFADKVKPFSINIVRILVTYVTSSQPSAYEKECATQTIFELVANNAMHDSVELDKLIVDVMNVLNQKKTTIRLQQHIYELLGLLSKLHPEKFNKKSATDLRNKMLSTIQSLFTDDKIPPSLSIISGAVEGLRNHLINFTPSIEDDPEFSERLYECMVQLSDPEKAQNSSSNNKVAFRNMLEMITEHGSLHQIPSLLFRDYRLWHTYLTKWINQKSYDDKKAGINAMQTFHQQIAKLLEQRRIEEDKRILEFFLKYFQDTLESVS
jgi:hypothetical protein